MPTGSRRAYVSLLLACLLAAAAGGCADAGPFEAPLHRAHPLVGTVWSRSAGGPSDLAALEARLATARFVLLGETHDNPHHHRLQARFVADLARRGERPAVVFEMLDPAQQAAIDAFLAAGGRDPEAFAERVAWATSGWPAFALYRPLFRVVLDAGLPIRAAGLPRGETLAPDAPERAPRLGLGEPLAPAAQAARLDEMFAAHCELVPREALAPMVEVQRARDARMALGLLDAAAGSGRAVLVAGTGHVRAEGVPALLERAGVARDARVSVGLLEVDPARPRVADTRADAFDFAVFTPAAERDDPCEALRRRLEGRKPADE